MVPLKARVPAAGFLAAKLADVGNWCLLGLCLLRPCIWGGHAFPWVRRSQELVRYRSPAAELSVLVSLLQEGGERVLPAAADGQARLPVNEEWGVGGRPKEGLNGVAVGSPL